MPFDRVRFFNAGHCTQLGYFAGSKTRGRTRFNNVFIHLEHPRHGVSLIDAGYSPHFFEATEDFPARLYRWTLPVHLDEHRHAAAILQSRGLPPEAVREIFISHFHGDHVAGLKDFPAARAVYRRTAIESLLRQSEFRQVGHGFLAKLLPGDIAARGTAIEDDGFTGTFAGFPALDYFGDGDLLLVDLPGHAPGHTGFAFRTQERQFFYIADACWDVEAMLAAKPLPLITRRLQHSYDAYAATQETLRHFAQRDDWTMLACHCPRTQRYVD
jgi:glyoxylase-like metal-dependent hydrolase (beta-lactamase superfamily II)